MKNNSKPLDICMIDKVTNNISKNAIHIHIERFNFDLPFNILNVFIFFFPFQKYVYFTLMILL